MANYYVATTGNNANDGSSGFPWQTIGYAIAAGRNLQPGDNVIVRAGTYNVTANLVPAASGSAAGGKITIKSEVKGGAKIVATSNQCFRIDNKKYIRIEGFDMTSALSCIVVTNCSDVDVVNNICHGVPQQGIYMGRGEFYLIEGNDVYDCADGGGANNSIICHLLQPIAGNTGRTGYRMIIRGNYAHDNGITGSSTDSAGIMVDQDENNPQISWSPVAWNFPRLVENNLCCNNAGSGIIVLASSHAEPAGMNNSMDCLVRNNTCYKNGQKDGAAAMVGNLTCRAGGTKWVNNIAVADITMFAPPDHASRAIAVVSLPAYPIVFTGITWYNNITWNSVNNDVSCYSNNGNSGNLPVDNVNGNNLGTNPMFVNAAGGNWRLATGSPAIDTGTSAQGGMPTVDFDGNARTEPPCMGAFEFATVTPPTGTMHANSSVAVVAAFRTTSTDMAADVSLPAPFTQRHVRSSPAPTDYFADTGNTVQNTFGPVTKTAAANHLGAIVIAYSMKPEGT